MKFEVQAQLTVHTNRLLAASAATAACAESMKDPEQQVFDYAGQRFTGPDAMLLKECLLKGLGGIADSATKTLKQGGVTFDGIEPGAAANTNRAGRRAHAAKVRKKVGK